MLQAVAEQTESDLSARLAQIDAAIRNGEGDIPALLAERETARRQVEAQRIRKAARADQAYRANMEAKSAEFRAKLMPCAEEIADLIPRLLWHLRRLESLELESLQGVGNVDFAETGIPYNFSKQVAQAIRAAAPDVEWHFDFVSDPSARNPLPTQKATMRVTFKPRLTDLHGNYMDSTTYL